MVSSTRAWRLQHRRNRLARAHLAPQRVEPVAAGRIDQQARDGVQPFIAGGAGDARNRRHCLALGEDFLDHDVERCALAAVNAPNALLQPPCVLRRVEQAIDVIEPQPLKLTGGDEPRDQFVHVAERPRVLDPEPGQLVDVEEAPVVDARHREPPVREAIVLPLQQPMQRADAGLVVGAVGGEAAIDNRRGAVDAGQPLLQLRRRRVGRLARPRVGVGQRQQHASGRLICCLRCSDHCLDDVGITLRIDRKALAEIPRREAAQRGVPRISPPVSASYGLPSTGSSTPPPVRYGSDPS